MKMQAKMPRFQGGYILLKRRADGQTFDYIMSNLRCPREQGMPQDEVTLLVNNEKCPPVEGYERDNMFVIKLHDNTAVADASEQLQKEGPNAVLASGVQALVQALKGGHVKPNEASGRREPNIYPHNLPEDILKLVLENGAKAMEAAV